MKRVRRSWQHFVVMVAAWLVFGAIVNVAVTWGALLTSRGWAIPTDKDEETEWPVAVPSHWPKRAMTTSVGHRWIKDTTVLSYYGKETLVPGSDIRTEYGTVVLNDAGWPARSLREWSMFGRPDIRTIRRFAYPVRQSDGTDIYLFLPCRPLWPGFALNTIFYAAIAWGLWQIPLAIRRTRRRRAGKCVRCGYDLKGLAAGSTCPECGIQPRA